MTIASELNRVTYTGNGVTVAFAVSYPFQSAADLVVIETIIATGVQTTKTLTTHYTVSGTTDSLGYYPNGGTVTAVTAPASTVRWTIYRDPALLQSLNLSENNALPAESLEAQLDYATMLIQRLNDQVNRSLRQPDGDSADIATIPSKVDRASHYLAFDANGDPTAAAAGTTSTVTAFMATVLDDTSSSAAAATLAVLPLSGGTMTGALVQAVGANVASASTINLTNVAGNACHVTGTTTITAVTLATGKFCEVIFDGILTLTHHTTNNNLPSAANITTAAGDRAAYWSDGTTVYCLRYQRASGASLVGGTAGQIVGTATNDNASAGNVGEYLSSSVASGSPVAMTSGVSVNITSLSLTAGDWDVYGVVGAKGAGTTTINYWVGSISNTTGTIDTANDRRIAVCMRSDAFSFTALYTQQIGPARISLAGTTTIYLVTEAGFGVSTCDAYGILHARRRR